MKFAAVLFLSLVIAVSVFAQSASQPPAPAQAPPTISSVLDRQLSGVERILVAAAEAMPEDKYGFAPTNGEFKGVRTFAEQVKHAASTNVAVFSAILGEPAPKAGEQNAALKTKADILKYLRDSFALGHRAMAGITEQNAVVPIKGPYGNAMTTRLGLATMIVGHCFDTYGQMVEYLRMNGIIPPASRRYNLWLQVASEALYRCNTLSVWPS
jgi:hypothetical protein